MTVAAHHGGTAAIAAVAGIAAGVAGEIVAVADMVAGAGEIAGEEVALGADLLGQ